MFGGKSKKNGGNIDRITNSKNSKRHWTDLGESFDDEDDDDLADPDYRDQESGSGYDDGGYAGARGRNYRNGKQNAGAADDTYDTGEIYADENYYVSEAYDAEAGGADEEYYADEAYGAEAGYADEDYYADEAYGAGAGYADEEYYASEAYDTETGYADGKYYTGEAYNAPAGYPDNKKDNKKNNKKDKAKRQTEKHYADEEYISEKYASKDRAYETDEDYREEEDYEAFDDDEGYDAEEYDDDYGYDDDREDSAFRRLIDRIQDKLADLGAVDYIVALTGLAVLIMAAVTGLMYFNAKNKDEQVAAFAEVGSQMEGITVIGERGLIAVADAELAKSLAAAQEPDAEAAEGNGGTETEGTAGNQVKVQMKLSSIQKDLKIKFVNEDSGKLIPNMAFEVRVTAPGGQESTMVDDDKDGIIYETELPPGKYRVAMTQKADAAAYRINTEAVTITVKDTIEYKKVDVTDEIKKESQIDVAVEDTKVNETAQESANVDTVEWVESTKTPIAGTENSSSQYEEVAKSNIPEPGKTAKAELRLPAPRFTDGNAAMPLAAARRGTLTADDSPVSLAAAGHATALTAADSSVSLTAAGRLISPFHIALATNETPTAEPAATSASEGAESDGGENLSTPDPTPDPTKDPGEGAEPTPGKDPVPTPSASVESPTAAPTKAPAATPQATPSVPPAATPAATPTASPTVAPTASPTATPTASPTASPIATPTASPTSSPTATPNNARNDTRSKLTDKGGKQVYIRKSDGSYAEAVYADYFNSSKFYQRVTVTTAEYRYTGWQELNGNTYFFDKNGVKVTGEQIIQGAPYNFGSDGALSRSSGHMGIDVSKWNGTINWTAVKNSGVSYVIIRCGYRGSTNGALIEDPTFRANIKGATAAGLKVGVYFFTQAVNEVEAVEEASAVLGFISGYNLSYPVFLDVEATAGNGRANGISKETRTAVCRAFCNTIQSSGYKAGIYANKTWLTSHINTPALTQYKIWLAQYADKPSYTGTRYDMWQYSSTGSIGGISGNVDLNISYMGY